MAVSLSSSHTSLAAVQYCGSACRIRSAPCFASDRPSSTRACPSAFTRSAASRARLASASLGAIFLVMTRPPSLPAGRAARLDLGRPVGGPVLGEVPFAVPGVGLALGCPLAAERLGVAYRAHA